MKRSSSQLAGLAAFVAVGFFAFVAIRSVQKQTTHSAAPMYTDEQLLQLPIPFFENNNAGIGTVQNIGAIRLGSVQTGKVVPVKLVTFNKTANDKREDFLPDEVYVVEVPDGIPNVPLNVPWLPVVNNREPDVIFYRYKPNLPEIALNRDTPTAAIKVRYPGEFGTSDYGWEEDAKTTAKPYLRFFTDNQLTRVETDGTDPLGFLTPGVYVFVTNIAAGQHTTLMMDPPARCGDRWKMDPETCDDGNATAGDGCSATCTVEGGYTCTGNPSVCTQSELTISGITVEKTVFAADVHWTTNVAADSQVEYGTTNAYGTTTDVNAAPTTDHTINLIPLMPDTTYHFRVKSKIGASGTPVVSADNTFTTPPFILDMSVTNITRTSATIVWTTPMQETTSRVKYGPTTAYESITPATSDVSTSHSVTLTGLTPSTLYHFKAISTLISSNLPAIESTDGNFTTFDLTSSASSNAASSAASSVASTTCGNGTIETGEDCDEGAQNGQGVCTTQCHFLIPF